MVKFILYIILKQYKDHKLDFFRDVFQNKVEIWDVFFNSPSQFSVIIRQRRLRNLKDDQKKNNIYKDVFTYTSPKSNSRATSR